MRDWREGRLDGLREALGILRALEADVAERLERTAPPLTQRARLVRRQAYKNGAERIATRLRRLDKTTAHVAVDLARIGL